MILSRDNRSSFADWWWTVDRVALFAMLGLIAIGLMLAFAASPAATAHNAIQAGNFHFAAKQIVFAAVAALVVAGCSLLSPRDLKLAAGVVFLLALAGSGLVLLTGAEVLGARRWIDLGWITIQPSEFLKPSFAVLCAAVLATQAARRSSAKELISFALVLFPLLLLILEPDVGQTGTASRVVGSDAVSRRHLARLGRPDHRDRQRTGRRRLRSHSACASPGGAIFRGGKPGYQSGLAIKAFEHGGLAGVGPGAGTIKYHIPYAHSDFILAVAGEEFGLVLCGIIAALFCLLSVRLLLRSASAPRPLLAAHRARAWH